MILALGSLCEVHVYAGMLDKNIHVFPFMSFRSQSIADVVIEASFSPDKITLLNKEAKITLKLCFRANFKPTGQNHQVGK